MTYDGFSALKVRLDRGIAWVTLDHPPINLLDLPLIAELDQVGRALEQDTDVRVVVIDSADREFFSAHADVTLIKALPTEDTSLHGEVDGFQAMVDRFRTMPKATIAVIEGVAAWRRERARPLLRHALRRAGRAVLAQPEVAVGIIPGGSGTQRLPVLIGRARALEVVLGCGDVDARTAERWGYVNRALPDGELRPFVEALALRIASFPAQAIAVCEGVRRCRSGRPRRWAPLRGPAVPSLPERPRDAAPNVRVHGSWRTDTRGRATRLQRLTPAASPNSIGAAPSGNAGRDEEPPS